MSIILEYGNLEKQLKNINTNNMINELQATKEAIYKFGLACTIHKLNQGSNQFDLRKIELELNDELPMTNQHIITSYYRQNDQVLDKIGFSKLQNDVLKLNDNDFHNELLDYVGQVLECTEHHDYFSLNMGNVIEDAMLLMFLNKTKQLENRERGIQSLLEREFQKFIENPRPVLNQLKNNQQISTLINDGGDIDGKIDRIVELIADYTNNQFDKDIFDQFSIKHQAVLINLDFLDGINAMLINEYNDVVLTTVNVYNIDCEVNEYDRIYFYPKIKGNEDDSTQYDFLALDLDKREQLELIMTSAILNNQNDFLTKFDIDKNIIEHMTTKCLLIHNNCVNQYDDNDCIGFSTEIPIIFVKPENIQVLKNDKNQMELNKIIENCFNANHNFIQIVDENIQDNFDIKHIKNQFNDIEFSNIEKVLAQKPLLNDNSLNNDDNQVKRKIKI